jgi:hypothetical protein
MAHVARIIDRWSRAIVAIVGWGLFVWWLVATAPGPGDGRILCPTNIPNCHEIGAPWPIGGWAVVADFVVIIVVAVIGRQALDRPR